MPGIIRADDSDRRLQTLAGKASVPHWSLAVAGGYPLLSYGAEAVRIHCGSADKRLLTGAIPKEAERLLESAAPDFERTLSHETAQNGQSTLTIREPSLFVSARHPFTDAGTLEEFRSRTPARSDISIGVVPLELYQRRYDATGLDVSSFSDVALLFAGLVSINSTLSDPFPVEIGLNRDPLPLASKKITADDWCGHLSERYGLEVSLISLENALAGFRVSTYGHLDYAARLFAALRS